MAGMLLASGKPYPGHDCFRKAPHPKAVCVAHRSRILREQPRVGLSLEPPKDEQSHSMILTNTKYLRAAGWAQLAFSAALIMAIVFAYWTYGTTLRELTRSLAGSTRSAADLIGGVAETIKVRQELVRQSRQTLLTSRKLLETMQASAASQGPLLSRYTANLIDAAKSISVLGNTLTQFGDGLMFDVPTSIRMNGVVPKIDFSKPLAPYATHFYNAGQRFNNLSVSVSGTALAMANDVPRLNAAFAETSKQTLLLLDNTAKSMDTLTTEDMPKAIGALEDLSRSLLEASKQVDNIEQFTIALLIVGLLLALCFGVQGVGVLVTSKWIEQLKTAATA